MGAASAKVDAAMKQAPQALAASAQQRVSGEEPEILRQRQATEFKAMKAQVAQLKKQRSTISKKGGGRKAVSQKIRKLVTDLRSKHEAELKAAGLEVTAA